MSAANDLKMAEGALKDPKFKGPYEFEGNSYTLSELRDILIPELKKRSAAEVARGEEVSTAQAKLRNQIAQAQEKVDFYSNSLRRDRNAFRKGRISEAELAATEQKLADAISRRDALSTREAYPTTTVAEPVVTPTAMGQTVEEKRLAGLQPIPKLDDEEPTETVAPVSTKVTKKQVTDTLTVRGLPDTPENRAAIRSELSGKKPAAPTYQAGWEDEVRRQYAKYSWMLDELDREKYSDVFDLLAEAVNPQTKITDPALFLTRFEATSWYKELATQQMGRRVREQVGALSFDSGNYARLLNNAMRYGWEGENLKAEAYKEVFRRNDDGTFANQNAIGEARKSNDYLKVKSIGTSYLSEMSDDRIVQVLTGGTTSDDLLRIYREKAKVNNPHLAAAIDAGVTLEDMAYDYRKAASDVLGTPLSGIPLTEDFVGQALKTGEPGKYRVMSTNEWKYLLKSNPDFGYQYTTNARKEVNDVVSSLEKAFGFVK